MTQLNGAPKVLRNATQGGNHWLGMLLRGRRSNRDGIGARVHVVTARGEQWNRVTTSVGYAGSSDRALHFGLGEDAEVALVEIEWPSGIRQQLRNVAAGQYLSIEEPDK